MCFNTIFFPISITLAAWQRAPCFVMTSSIKIVLLAVENAFFIIYRNKSWQVKPKPNKNVVGKLLERVIQNIDIKVVLVMILSKCSLDAECADILAQ